MTCKSFAREPGQGEDLPTGQREHPIGRVDGSQLLPSKVKEGASAEGVEVTEMGERAVWYGTFPDVASVTVSTGTLAGEWAFARDIGPIVAHIAGDTIDMQLVVLAVRLSHLERPFVAGVRPSRPPRVVGRRPLIGDRR